MQKLHDDVAESKKQATATENAGMPLTFAERRSLMAEVAARAGETEVIDIKSARAKKKGQK